MVGTVLACKKGLCVPIMSLIAKIYMLHISDVEEEMSFFGLNLKASETL